MSHEKGVGEAGSKKKNNGLEKRLLNLWPIWILSALYLFSPVIAGGNAYNLIAAGVLTGFSSIAGLRPGSWLKKTAQYTFIVGLVMGIVSVSPPIYFTTVHGLVSPVELALSVVCIILTVMAVLKIRSLGMF